MSKVAELQRTEDGKFPRGVSGNPAGRPKGSKNQITLLKQSLELSLREQGAPHMSAVLEKAIEMALEGHPGMIKLLLELHLSKNTSDMEKAKEQVSITINGGTPKKNAIIDQEDVEDVEL